MPRPEDFGAVPIGPNPSDFGAVPISPGEMPSVPTGRTFPESLARQVGLTTRYGVQGVTALPAMIGNALGMNSSEAVSHLLDIIGLPRPESETEKIAAPISEAMAGQAGLSGVAGLFGKAGEALAAGPGKQILGAATGAASGEAAKGLGAGPVGQTAASVAGGAVPALIASGVPAAVKFTLRGGAKNVAPGEARIARFKELGVPTTPGQAFQAGPGQATEAYLARSPGGHKVMRTFSEKQAETLGQAVEKRAASLAEKSSPMMAGRAIEEGITGPGGFTDQFRKTSEALYTELDKYVPQDLRVNVTATKNALDELNAPIPGAPRLSKYFQNARMQGIKEALRADTETPAGALSQLGTAQREILGQLPPAEQTSVAAGLMDGKLPYQALKKLRTLVGNEISDSSLVGDVPRSKWRALYAALSRDMESAVNETGDPSAMHAFKRANAYTKAGYDRMDSVLKPITDRDAPEKIYMAAMAGTKQGDTTIHSVMHSLPPKAQRVVASTVLRKMGLALPSKQGAEGETFSVSRFLTNWTAMSPEAKRSLFSRYGPQFVEDLNKIAKTAEDIRMSGEVYANPSGTAPAFTLQATIGGAVLALLTGHPGVAAGIGGENLVSYLGARKITDPAFVSWLSKYSMKPIGALPVALNELAQQSQQQQKGNEKKGP